MGRMLSGCLTALGAFVVVFLGGAFIIVLLIFHRVHSDSQRSSIAQETPSQPVISEEAPKPTIDHTLRLEPNPFTGGAISDGRTYSVSLIDAKKNDIPTGTELFVQGTMFTATWTQEDACTWLLSGRSPVVQHGEIDPSRYCVFSIVLTEKNKAGGDLFPGVGLVCHVSPEEMRETTRLYHYGDEVQAHGLYADSLDFTTVPAPPGVQFGIPALDNCTFADSTDNVVRLSH